MNPLSYHKLFPSKTNNAHLITFDDGADYVVKLYKNSENKALINEWLAHCLARYLELPVPSCYLIDMPEEFVLTIPSEGDIQYTSKQFASKYIKGSVNGHEVNAPNIVNVSDMAKIIVFDYWLYNTDRTRKNILLQENKPGSYHLWAIDHADLFGSYSWTAEHLENLPAVIMKSATHEIMAACIPNEEDFKKQLQIIQSIPTQLIEEILSFIPPDWNLSTEEQEALIKALNYRRYKTLPGLITTFIQKIYHPIQSKSVNG